MEKEKKKKRSRPALTPEAREMQLISLAVECAEKQLREGTASSQVITHYLKLGSTTTQLEKIKLEYETKLIQARAEALETEKQTKEMFEKAIKAMKTYSGHPEEEEVYDEED